jgi:hypothetical protein
MASVGEGDPGTRLETDRVTRGSEGRMILKGRGEFTPSEAAKELLRDADALKRHARTVGDLEARVAAFEQRFELSSSDIHEAIDAGTLHESADVCTWIFDNELLQHVRATSKT